MIPLEGPDGPAPTARHFFADLDSHGLANGLVAFLFAATGPLVILLSVAKSGGLSEAETASWIFACFGISGLFTMVFSWRYRMTAGMAWTIPGSVLLVSAFEHLSFAEIVGAMLASGLLIGLLGITGLVRRVMEAIPMPVVMGMVAGVFLPFGLEIVRAFGPAPAMAGAMVVAFVAVSLHPPLARRLPPTLAALLAGLAVLLAQDRLGDLDGLRFALAEPVWQRPAFSWQAMLELVIPLTITVVVIQNGQGFVILKQAGYRPPQNTLTAACGLGSVIFAFLGSVPMCVTGPSNGILNTSGDLSRRWAAAVLFGLLMFLFGLFAPVTTGLGLALPAAYIGLLGGLAMLPVLQGAFTTAFQGRHSLAALVAFLVTVADQALFNVGAAFWGLVFGYLASRLLERDAA